MKTSAIPFLKRHEKKIKGVLGCYARIVMTGTLLDVAYPAAVQNLLSERGLRCFEIGEFAEPLREGERGSRGGAGRTKDSNTWIARGRERRIALRPSSSSGAIIRGSFTSFRRWKTAGATSRGTTGRRGTPSCG